MCVEEQGGAGRLFRVLAMMPDEKLNALASVLLEAKDLSDEELEERLTDVLESRGENPEEADDATE
jgi:hypothetical protein